MKKTIAALGMATLLAFGAVASGAGDGASGVAAAGPVKLVLWHETEPPIAEQIAAELKELEPGIKVEVVRKERVTESLKLASGDASSAPDLFWFAHDKVGVFVEMGALEPIDAYLPPAALSGFIPVAVEAGKYKGKQYQVPATVESLLFMYNRALMPTPPKTTDELLAMMKKGTGGGRYVFAEQHSTAYFSSAWLHPFGAYLINAKAEPGLGSKQFLDAIRYHKEFVEHEPREGDYNTVTTLFTEGKCAAMINGPWFVPAARSAGIDLSFAPMPVASGTGKPLAPFLGVQGLMLVSTTRHKEAAVAVIKHLASKGLGERLALNTGAAPAHLDAYKNPKIAEDALLNAVRATAEKATPMPNIPEMDVMWTVSENALVAINKKGEDPAKVLAAAQAEALRLIADMK